MDTRFPPPPKRISVPLYPKRAQFAFRKISHPDVLLREVISTKLKVNKEDILFAESGSNALFVYLSQYKNTTPTAKLNIALPAYNCVEVLDAIISAGYHPVFIDLAEDLSISDDAADFTILHECDFILWPNYFGPRVRNEIILKKLVKNNVKIIFDEAQSFPLMYEKIMPQIKLYATVVLISFGHNKPIAGSGGGALYAQNFKPVYTNKQAKVSIFSWAQDQFNTICQKIQLHSPPFHKLHLRNRSVFYDRLDNLLNDQRRKVHIMHVPINFMDAYCAYRNILEMEKNTCRHSQDYKDLCERSNMEKTNVDKYIREVINFPSIMALAMPSSERYELLRVMSSNNIQTTWYYYPLNKITKNKNYLSQKTECCNKIAASVIIIPFNWYHSKTQKRKVLNILVRLTSEVME